MSRVVIKNTCVHLIQNDCVSEMDKMDRDYFDIAVTSPPYNLKKKYRSYIDNKPLVDYLKWTSKWIKSVHGVLAQHGSLFLNIGSSSKNPHLPFQVLSEACKFFHLQNTFHWVKSISIDRDGETESFGHFKPINSRRYVNDLHEYVFHLTKSPDVSIDRLAIGVPYADKTNIKRWSGKKDIRCRGNIWFIPYKTITSSAKDRPHPATFPPALAAQCIKINGKSNPRVIDPFVGLGNSAVAAVQCHAGDFVGIDIDEFYLQESLKKVSAYV